jgi:hypothetical protein
MPFQNNWCGLRRGRSSSALVGAVSSLVLLFAAFGLTLPAASQIMIGIGGGGGGGGIGIGGIGIGGGPAVQDAPPPRAASSGDHRSRKTKSARHSSDDSDRHAKEAHGKRHSDSDSSSRGAGADETSFPSR